LLEHLLQDDDADGNSSTTKVDRYGAYNNATTREDHALFTLLIQKEYAEKDSHPSRHAVSLDRPRGELREGERDRPRGDGPRDARSAVQSADRFRSFASPVRRSRVRSSARSSRSRDDAGVRGRLLPEPLRPRTVLAMGDFEADSMLPPSAYRRA
jgi:hypothetical protein